MTARLYYTDSYTSEFEGTILRVADVDGKCALVLDQTHFYPTSGGQPHDLGTLGDANVIDVIAADGEVLHLVDRTLPESAVEHIVHGTLDWERRYDHMQQHAGQHLLSQTLYQLFGYETVSVHFGATESTLDLATPDVSAAVLAEAERFANTLVFSNLPIRAYCVDENEIGRLPLRRPPQVTGKIRVVEIHQFDWSACGGTHVRATGEIGAVKVIKQERRRDQIRLTFLCGWRSVRDYTAKHELLAAAATLFSNDMAQVPELIARSQEQNKDLQHRIEELDSRLLAYQAAELQADAQVVGQVKVITRLFDDKDANAVRGLASRLQTESGTVVLLASTASGKVAAVFAASDDLALHAGNLLRTALQQFGGGGGGRRELAQGGGIPVDAAQSLLDYALDQVRQSQA